MLNTEYILMAEDKTFDYTFEEIYPYYLPFPLLSVAYNIYYPGKGASNVKQIKIAYDMIPLEDYQGVWTDESVSKWHLIDNTVYAVTAFRINDTFYSAEEIANSIGICYYGMIESRSNGNDVYFDQIGYRTATLVNLEKEDIENAGLTYNPFTNEGTTFNGENWFEFLANLGKDLTIESGLSSILELQIGGYSLISLIFGAGFIVYAVWVIAKWAIPGVKG